LFDTLFGAYAPTVVPFIHMHNHHGMATITAPAGYLSMALSRNIHMLKT
jgi:hypothetical protein